MLPWGTCDSRVSRNLFKDRRTKSGLSLWSCDLSVWFLLTTRARRWAPPRAALTRWWPSTDPASSPSLQGATTARYPPGVRARGPGQEGMNGTAGLDERT